MATYLSTATNIFKVQLSGLTEDRTNGVMTLLGWTQEPGASLGVLPRVRLFLRCPDIQENLSGLVLGKLGSLTQRPGERHLGPWLLQWEKLH